jgi:hypothetical protein
MPRSLKIKEPTQRFDVLSTFAGFQVIDRDGTPLSGSLPWADANNLARRLDFAAFVGRANLTAALAGETELL